MVGESAKLFTSTTINWQIKRSPVCLIAHHKITPLLTLLHGRGVMLNEAIPIYSKQSAVSGSGAFSPC
ncbi:MAG: hypothetical protein V7K89_27035 [Nostoc sp.]|uniref:hypothetical protein n=1 Tax=Nostoc sp. TaxID=1180 RepID=UPI002FF81B9C